MTETYWGYHLLLDCANCNHDKMTDKQNINNFVKTLIVRIDMEAIGEPWIETTAGHLPDKSGYSLFQMIVTSNISGHFIDATNEVYLDVFSCKPFDLTVVEDTVREYFEPSKIRLNYITRNAG